MARRACDEDGWIDYEGAVEALCDEVRYYYREAFLCIVRDAGFDESDGGFDDETERRIDALAEQVAIQTDLPFSSIEIANEVRVMVEEAL